ncbi:type II restriction endonuclease [Lysinibacillus fusiformis]|uniref:type II restriction endonuclease n=1 Tax=Lysinibacillus fusiformis TaxID=28031 RepID=UPI003CEEF625
MTQSKAFDFIEVFQKKLTEYNLSWEIAGLVDKSGVVYPLGTDSKLIGRIFEMIIVPILTEIADENDYSLEMPSSQNTYPDFIFSPKNLEPGKKVAIDIKTTFRSYYKRPYKGFKAGEPRPYVFTLGSFASFLRNGTKNIQGHYNDYDKHYVVGFIYDRAVEQDSTIVKITELDLITPPILNVECFVQEKYKIVGEKPGSGNTENIGSIKTNSIEYLKEGKGPFSYLGQEVYEHYWSNYPRYRATNQEYTTLSEYFEWLDKKTDKTVQVKELKEKYNEWLVKESPASYLDLLEE